jgi:hypothetical protein
VGRRVWGSMPKRKKSGDVSAPYGISNSGKIGNITIQDKDETILLLQKMLDDMRELLKQKEAHIVELEALTKLQSKHIMRIQRQLAFELFRKDKD